MCFPYIENEMLMIELFPVKHSIYCLPQEKNHNVKTHGAQSANISSIAYLPETTKLLVKHLTGEEETFLKTSI